MITQKPAYCIIIMLLNLHAVARQNSDSASLIRGPYLQVATSTSILIRWRTDIKADSRVRYGLSRNSLTKTAYDAALTTEHILQLSGLDPHTRYYYAVEASG